MGKKAAREKDKEERRYSGRRGLALGSWWPSQNARKRVESWRQRVGTREVTEILIPSMTVCMEVPVKGHIWLFAGFEKSISLLARKTIQ